MSAKLPKGRHWGEVLKKIRKDRNLSQPELGALIEHARGDGERIVYPQHLVGRYERTASPSMHTVEAMLSLLGYKIRLKPLPWPNDEVKAILDARKERAQASRKSVVRSEAPAAADTEALVDEVASDEPGPEPSTESGGSVVPSEPAPEGDSVDKAIEKRQ